MEIFGNTRIYGVKMIDSVKGLEYNISATLRDLYDTLTEEGDNVKLYLSTKGPSNLESLVRIKSITKVENPSSSVFRFRDILSGINEELTGNDSSIYCSGDTEVLMNGIISPVEFMKLSKDYEVTKLDIESPDMYSMQIFPINGKILVRNIVINGINVLITNKKAFQKPFKP